MTNAGAKASLRKVVTPQEARSTTKTRRRHQPTIKKVALLRGSLGAPQSSTAISDWLPRFFNCENIIITQPLLLVDNAKQ